MIALTFAVLWARRRQAVALFLLAALATGGVALAPVYLARTEDGIVADQVALARPEERTMLVAATVEPEPNTGTMDPRFERAGARLLDAPGYTQVFSSSFTAQPAQLPAVFLDGTRQLAYRQDVCEHVQVVSGRCLMGRDDAVLTEDTARRLGIRLGDPLSLAASAYNSTTGQFVPAGAPGQLTVVGIVRPVPSPYWAGGGNVSDASTGNLVFVDRRTFDSFKRPSELQVFVAYPQPGAITVATVPRLRAWLAQLDTAGSGGRASIGLGDLLDRIDADRAAARAPVPFAALPVALLGCAVLLFAVATGVRASRFEHGVVALRGAHRAARWWLAAAEPAIPILAGGVLGGLAAGFGSVTALGYGVALTAAAVLAGAAVAVRAISAPLSDLLRRVDRRGARWRSATFDVLVVLLGAVAVAHFHTSGDTVYGVAPLAPALLMLAVALLSGRAVVLLAGRAAGSALRRGHLVAALAAVRLARQPSGRRLLTVLVAAVALLGFATTGVAVAAGTQRTRADVAVGADRVLTVAPTTRQRLLTVTRAADPDGHHAMAVVPLEGMLAVDTTRLPAAVWRASYAGQPLADLVRAVRPIPAAPAVVVRGDTVTFDLTATRLDGLKPGLVAYLAPLDGGAGFEVRLGDLAPGRHTYARPAPCAAGCRLAGLEVGLPVTAGPTVSLTMHGPPTRDWRTPPDATVTAAADGVHFDLRASARRDAGLLRPAGVPDRLPVLSTGPLPPDGLLDTFDDNPVPAAVVAAARTLPRLGRQGMLIDLEYADRLAVDSGVIQGAEIWLAPGAPPSIVDELTTGGLTVTGERTVSGERALLSRTGGALGMRFSLLAGVAAVLLGAACLLVTSTGADRTDLVALRRQGAPARVTRRVERAAMLALVTLAVLAGSAAAAGAWFAVGRYLPGVDPRFVPPPGPVLASLAAATAALAGAAVAGTRSRIR
ncbi:hypothetical protein Daura_28290 [Dactylosporangium aurantiacum]|uniref:Uncharacterized protein n=1 Tax=Dactylosporangium aurantiacum TaxID=35754 RepID=A0A9Q9I7G6_9ACTN|nr:hypothetical protein [Dactylosporangium aurantiacum]MDG6106920.1 hypothetical protein [Dactylosporangium aurantiacum]UWZ50717.1 hypothetical protein Daura_28290 [Dactylosporangium aurantiacum]